MYFDEEMVQGRRVLTERLLLVLHLLDLTSCICRTSVYEESRAVVEVQVECVGIKRVGDDTWHIVKRHSSQQHRKEGGSRSR